MDYLNTKGRIFDIQRFSVHDGPGIRTIVFLKGCALRCKWCCNPESQEFAIQNMMVNGKVKVMGKDVTVAEVMEDVCRDRIYYMRSGGGLTLSGGECFCQSDFTYALLRAAKDAGINTAVETTSFAEFEKIEKCLPYIDHYLMDIKHMDTNKHKQNTRAGNELILENAKKIAHLAKDLVIRVPVIPGFNDTPEEIYSIAEFTKSLGTVGELHLLPYHRLGKDKYTGLDREYLMGDAPLHTKEHISTLKDAAAKSGLKIVTGG